MDRFSKLATGAAAALSLALLGAAAVAQPFGMSHGPMRGFGPGMAGGGHGPMGGPTAMLTKQDSGSASDMAVVHDLLLENGSIRRTVTNLVDGIRTVTESDDPQVAQSIKTHVASMSQRLQDGREFNIFSATLPVLFENRDKIASKVEYTQSGAVVTQTSSETKVVAALQAHAAEVTELAQDGMLAMRRGMMSRMAQGPRGMGRGPGVSRP
jgi:hypothetical protein